MVLGVILQSMGTVIIAWQFAYIFIKREEKGERQKDEYPDDRATLIAAIQLRIGTHAEEGLKKVVPGRLSQIRGA